MRGIANNPKRKCKSCKFFLFKKENKGNFNIFGKCEGKKSPFFGHDRNMQSKACEDCK